MITSTQIENTEIFAFIAVLVFTLLNIKDNRHWLKVGYIVKE